MKPKNESREGWAESFQEIYENGEDQLLIPDVFEDELFDDCKLDDETYLETLK